MSTPNTTAESTGPITFYRYRKDGSLNPDIRRCFLQCLTLSVEDALSGRIALEDGSTWTLVLESAVHQYLKANIEAACIVSFQVRTAGAYAVARLHTNTSTLNQHTGTHNK